MALISLTTAGKIEVLTQTETQHTAPAAEAITAGAPVLFNSTGKWINADANGAGAIGCWGIATRSVIAGEGLTAVRRGELDGFDLSSQAYGAPIYVSDTVGRLADAAGTATILVGHVMPVHGAPLGTAADKVLRVEITNTGVSA